MEFEIDDDPQGLVDRPEGIRDGGLAEDHAELRKRYARFAADIGRSNAAPGRRSLDQMA